MFHHVWEKVSNLWKCRKNALIRRIFTHVLPHSKLAPKFLSSRLWQKEITHVPRQHSFENLFSSTAEKSGENYDSHYQNLVKKYEDDLDH